MNIDPNTTMAGQRMITVRDIVRTIHRDFSGFFDRELLEYAWERCGATGGARERAALLDELERQGYARRLDPDAKLPTTAKPGMDAERWELTDLGDQLAMASAARPLRRATADRLLADFLDRVDEVERDPRCLTVVERVVLFGSMLDPQRDPVSDVDLAIDLVAAPDKFPEGIDQSAYTTKRVNQEVRGVTPTDDDPIAGHQLVGRRLKARKSGLSLHSTRGVVGDEHEAGVPHRVLYTREGGRT